jgi:threonylcarbamoyladenosine tRNA methylthiotransferase MtaB
MIHAELSDSPFAGLRVAFSTLGCKVNSSEAESFMSQFLTRGYTIVPFDDAADIYVVNTCTVTTIADRKSRQEIRRAGRANPLALVAATGCYVSVANRELGNLLPGNLLVVHNREKERLVERVEEEIAFRRSCTGVAMRPTQRTLAAGRAGMPVALLPVAVGADQQRTRATLKVQDGCNAGCTFCIIPRARGGPRSVPLIDAVNAARALEDHGYREVVLTGILLGSYGRDMPDTPSLAKLIEAILANTRRLRIRLSSIEAQDLLPEWFALWQDSRLCPHLHIPLQSGSDSVLQAMRRQYDTKSFAALVEGARAAIPDLAVTTDVLVGFPGETERECAETIAYLEEVGFAGMHVFRYSARPGTPAARMPNQVPESLKASRSERVRALAQEGKARFHSRFSGSVQEVLWEDADDGLWHGLTGNYLQVYTRQDPDPRGTTGGDEAHRSGAVRADSSTQDARGPGDHDLRNALCACILGEPYADGLWGTLRPNAPSPVAGP